MIELESAYLFESIEEMQLYIQQNGPLTDGKWVFAGNERIR